MVIGLSKDRNKVEGVVIKISSFTFFLYITKTWFKFEFQKTYFGWYFILRLFRLGFNFYFR